MLSKLVPTSLYLQHHRQLPSHRSFSCFVGLALVAQDGLTVTWVQLASRRSSVFPLCLSSLKAYRLHMRPIKASWVARPHYGWLVTTPNSKRPLQKLSLKAPRSMINSFLHGFCLVAQSMRTHTTFVWVRVRVRVILTCCCSCAHSPYIHSRNTLTPCTKGLTSKHDSSEYNMASRINFYSEISLLYNLNC